MNYVLYGEESYRLQKTIDNIVKQYIQDTADLNMITYDALQTPLATVLEDAMTIPFFADHKVILVTHANFLSTTNDTGSDGKELDAYIENPSPSTILILSGDFAKLDARKKLVKKIKANWKVLEFRKLDDIGKQSFVKEEILKRQIEIDAIGLQTLLQRLPFDMRMIVQELDKLELYGARITKDVITQLVTRPMEEDVFVLVNAVVDKNLKRAMETWQDLSVSNTDPIYLIALLSSQFRFLFQVKAMMLQGQTKEQITSALGAHPYRVKMSMESAKHLSITFLMEMLAKLADLDQRIKGGLVDKKLGFEMYLVESTRS